MRFNYLTLWLLAVILLTGCHDSKDEPVTDELLPGPAFVPQEVVPNSNFFANHERAVGYVLWPEATVDDTGLQGEGYFSYDYWWVHRAEAHSLEDFIVLSFLSSIS